MVRYNKYVSSVFFIFGFDSICPINSLTFSKLFEWQNHSIFYCRNLSIQVIKNYLYYFSAFSINKHSSSVSAHFLLIAKNRNGYFRYTHCLGSRHCSSKMYNYLYHSKKETDIQYKDERNIF